MTDARSLFKTCFRRCSCCFAAFLAYSCCSLLSLCTLTREEITSLINMIDFPPNTRMATTDDALILAQLINIAGEGLPEYFWNSMKEHDDESIWDVGQCRALRETGGFSYRNSVVREQDGQVVAALIGYKLPDALARNGGL